MNILVRKYEFGLPNSRFFSGNTQTRNLVIRIIRSPMGRRPSQCADAISRAAILHMRLTYLMIPNASAAATTFLVDAVCMVLWQYE